MKNLLQALTSMVVLTTLLLVTSAAQKIEYSEKEVRFKSGDVVLAGTFFVPKSKTKSPAIIITHGSGPDSRKFRNYRLRAAEFAGKGVAALIYDKRGVGDSTGEYIETPDLHIPAGDVLAAVRYLKKRKDIDPKKIGVMGTSQGGWVAPLAASMSDEIAFVISISGPGVSVREQVIYQTGKKISDYGFSNEDVAEMKEFMEKLYEYYSTGEGFNETKKAWAVAKEKKWFFKQLFGKHGEELTPPDKLPTKDFDFYRNLSYDPVPVLQRIEVPTLAVFGAMDRHIPVARSVAKWQETFEKGGNEEKLTLKVFPKAGHGINTIEEEKEWLVPPPDVKINRRGFVPGFLDFLHEWVLRITKLRAI
ncbi:MAG: alpha/beta fold hydrolase [Pyrinomonadaceae bacterium]|nr:alpha/beta fold hydrolase [Pyrinomonadaceae bacterium]